MFYQIKSALFGVAVGDALGVPVEFKSREENSQNPVKDMLGYGTYYQPPGTWSDDSSLTFCLAEALTVEFSLKNVADNLIKWYRSNYWTARGNIFDVGIATRYAIIKLEDGIQPELAGGTDSASNGNGSLMRILPLVFYLKDKPIHERFEITKQVSSITHRHIRSVIACFYYLEFALLLLQQLDKFEIYKNLQTTVSEYLNLGGVKHSEIAYYRRLLNGNIFKLEEDEILSTGYVLHTLEASIWCLLNTDNYEDAVLKAVNLGVDTDTTGAVTGGLAGLLYGFDNISANWINKLARIKDIEDLAKRFAEKIDSI